MVASVTMASASTSTLAAPARCKVRAQASAVAPVVMTSSMRTIFLPEMAPLRPCATAKALATSALLSAEAHLGLGWAYAQQSQGLNCDPGQGRDLVRQKRRLVEPPGE